VNKEVRLKGEIDEKARQMVEIQEKKNIIE
jgi:hypothetical protein